MQSFYRPGAALPFRFRVDEIAKPFDRRRIHLAAQKRAASEFPRFGRPHPFEPICQWRGTGAGIRAFSNEVDTGSQPHRQEYCLVFDLLAIDERPRSQVEIVAFLTSLAREWIKAAIQGEN